MTIWLRTDRSFWEGRLCRSRWGLMGWRSTGNSLSLLMRMRSRAGLSSDRSDASPPSLSPPDCCSELQSREKHEWGSYEYHMYIVCSYIVCMSYVCRMYVYRMYMHLNDNYACRVNTCYILWYKIDSIKWSITSMCGSSQKEPTLLVGWTIKDMK